MTIDSARAKLLHILERWPTKGEDVSAAAVRLERYLTTDFDNADLANTPTGRFDVVSRALLVGDQAKLIVRESCDPEPPNLAVMRTCADGEWRLESLKFQCVTCFGTGVDGTEPCNVCGATGWGLRDGELQD